MGNGLPVSQARVTATGSTTARTLADRAADVLATPDFGATASGDNTAALAAASAAVLARGGGVVRIPGGMVGTYTYSAADPTVLWEFDGPNVNRGVVGMGTATDSGKVFAGLLGTARPSGNNRAGVSDLFWAQGSGANGATHGDFAHSFQLYKQNWNCSTARQAAGSCTTVAAQGEMDTLYLSLYQGGPDATSSASLKSAGALMTGAATCIGGIGFCAQYELQTITLDPSSLAVTHNIDIQSGVQNSRTGEETYAGTIYNSDAGTQSEAILIQGSSTSRWTKALSNLYNGTETFAVADTGELTLDNGLYTPNVAAWTSGTTYNNGALVQTGGSIYQMVSGAAAVASVAPTCTSGTCAGADGITWLYLSTGSTAQAFDFTGGKISATRRFYLRSAQATQPDIPIIAAAGDPTANIVAPVGSLLMRTDGAPSRTLYLKESGTGNTGWSKVITSSTTNTQTATGTTQATAYALSTRTTVFTTVASGTGASLVASMNDDQIVINAGANALLLYPPSGGIINAHSANVAISVAASSEARCTYASAAQYYCTVSALP